VLTVPNTNGVTAVTVHPDGSVWGSVFCNGLCTQQGIYKVTLDQAGTTVLNVVHTADPGDTHCTGPCANHGIAPDKAGKVWSPQVTLNYTPGQDSGYVNRWNQDGTFDQRFPVDPGNTLYTYSDMTGILLRTVTLKQGEWIQDFDSGYAKPVWDHLAWTANIPQNTSITIQVRAADTEAAFGAGTATQWCGPFAGTAMTASLSACSYLNGHRWLEMDVKLATTIDGVRPTLSDIKAFWSYGP
jgi:hypothetical protein